MRTWIAAFSNSTEYLLSQQQTRNDTLALDRQFNATERQQQLNVRQGLVAQLRRMNPTCAECGAKGTLQLVFLLYIHLLFRGCYDSSLLLILVRVAYVAYVTVQILIGLVSILVL